MKYRKMPLRPWISEVDIYLMNADAMIGDKDPKIQDVYCKSNLRADINQKRIPLLSKSRTFRSFMWKLAFNKSVREYENKE